MDFYGLQEAARRKSARLTFVALLFAVAVAAATGFVFSVAAWCTYLVFRDGGNAPGYIEFAASHPTAHLLSYALALLVVLLSGLWSYSRISSGEALMRLIGARKARKDEDGTLLDVVEEMSIASGVDMPSVWVLGADEGVNAFVAGFGEPGLLTLSTTDTGAGTGFLVVGLAVYWEIFSSIRGLDPLDASRTPPSRAPS